MERQFTVGQRVACIYQFDAESVRQCALHDMVLPVLHHTYTVREVVLFHFSDGPAPALLLGEIRNPLSCNRLTMATEEIAFYHRLFRPLVPRETDITVFEDIRLRQLELTRVPTREVVR